MSDCHCAKSVQIRSYFWSVFSCIRIEYRKIRTRNNSVFGHFSRSVIDSNINHDEFVLVNNVLIKYNEMKEEIKNPENAVEYSI